MGYVTRYAYDESNNRISQTDANNHTTTMEYDKLNRLILRTYPNGDHEHFTYDANGNQTAKVDGVGDSTVFTYDNRNREIGRRFTNSGHTVLTKYTIDGKPDTIVDYRGMTTYKYDIRGRQASVTNPDGAFIRGYYDAQGNRISQKTPLDSVAYAYDSLNRMVAVSGQNSGTTNYFYDAVGNRDSVHSGNGTSAGYHYDNLNRLVNVTNHNASGPMSSYTYALNNAGIRTGVTELDGSHVAYGYDDCYKLTSEVRTGANPYTISYGYDNVGNRLSQTKDGQATTYMYNNRDQLTSETGPTGTTTNIYDHAGRLKSKTDASGTTTYGWIDNDRMASVTGPGISVTYGYDQNGLKVSETTAGNTKQYLVDYQLPYGQVVAETDDAGNPLASYIYGLDRISQTRTNNSLLTTHYYLTDGQGSVRQLTDLNGNVTDGWTFDAFGNIVNRTGTTPNMFLYVGEQWDANAGFYYNRARWYNPAQGRFTSVDPWSGDPQCPASLHRYLYCGADPINLIDPSGEYWNVQSALAGISLWMRIIATRIFPWILKGSPLIPTLPFLQKLANAPVTGPTVQVVTKLTQFPQAGRQLSCAIGENAEALANAARTTGTIFRANIPQQLFDALTKIQWAQTYYTSMGEVVGTEVVFSARAMALIIKFFQ
jgi:RHS repeat-associated protein